MPRFNPYEAEEHGWRGLSLPGNRKRKWYKILHNDQVLVTGLLLLPGEHGVRHSHETGELSVQFPDQMRPQVNWNPPGVLHGGAQAAVTSAGEPPKGLVTEEMVALIGGDAAPAQGIGELLEERLRMVEASLLERLKPQPAPRLLIEVLFPPFKTTIDDPEVGPPRTVVGQWFD